MVPAFLLAAVFLGQDHISTTVFVTRLDEMYLDRNVHYGLEDKDTYPSESSTFYFCTEAFKGPG